MNKIIPLSLLGVQIIKATMPLQTIDFTHQEYTTKNNISIKADIDYFKKKEEEERKQEEIRSMEESKTNNEVNSSYTTRMTSYYPAESSPCTGKGLCSWDFQVNDKGWYTYNGKLVVATATTYLLNEGFSLADGVHTYKYGDEITLNIDGVDYDAIVLDSCGSSMTTDRIDLFVSDAWAVKDTQIIVKE